MEYSQFELSNFKPCPVHIFSPKQDYDEVENLIHSIEKRLLASLTDLQTSLAIIQGYDKHTRDTRMNRKFPNFSAILRITEIVDQVADMTVYIGCLT